jgi:hypothetical protein
MRFCSPDRKPFGASMTRGSAEAENGEPPKIKGTVRGVCVLKEPNPIR